MDPDQKAEIERKRQPFGRAGTREATFGSFWKKHGILEPGKPRLQKFVIPGVGKYYPKKPCKNGTGGKVWRVYELENKYNKRKEELRKKKVDLKKGEIFVDLGAKNGKISLKQVERIANMSKDVLSKAELKSLLTSVDELASGVVEERSRVMKDLSKASRLGLGENDPEMSHTPSNLAENLTNPENGDNKLWGRSKTMASGSKSPGRARGLGRRGRMASSGASPFKRHRTEEKGQNRKTASRPVLGGEEGSEYAPVQLKIPEGSEEGKDGPGLAEINTAAVTLENTEIPENEVSRASDERYEASLNTSRVDEVPERAQGGEEGSKKFKKSKFGQNFQRGQIRHIMGLKPGARLSKKIEARFGSRSRQIFTEEGSSNILLKNENFSQKVSKNKNQRRNRARTTAPQPRDSKNRHQIAVSATKNPKSKNSQITKKTAIQGSQPNSGRSRHSKTRSQSKHSSSNYRKNQKQAILDKIRLNKKIAKKMMTKVESDTPRIWTKHKHVKSFYFKNFRGHDQNPLTCKPISLKSYLDPNHDFIKPRRDKAVPVFDHESILLQKSLERAKSKTELISEEEKAEKRREEFRERCMRHRQRELVKRFRQGKLDLGNTGLREQITELVLEKKFVVRSRVDSGLRRNNRKRRVRVGGGGGKLASRSAYAGLLGE